MIYQAADSIPWVCCASGNVLLQRSCQVALLALVPILATRCLYLNWLRKWPPDGTTCISCRFSQQLAFLQYVKILAIKWCHLLAQDSIFATRWHHSYCHIAYPHQPESHKLGLQIVLESLSDIRTHRSDPNDT